METKPDYLAFFEKNDIVQVKFEKANGEIRVMDCTRNVNLIPKEHLPYVYTIQSHPHEDKPDVITVFDLENEGWRSFRIDRIISITGL